jgi:hypothetical protein
MPRAARIRGRGAESSANGRVLGQVEQQTRREGMAQTAPASFDERSRNEPAPRDCGLSPRMHSHGISRPFERVRSSIERDSPLGWC